MTHIISAASHQDLRLTQDDVLLLSQASPRESPSEGLFNRMAEKRTNMLELYEYLHQADLLAVMNIVQKYSQCLHIDCDAGLFYIYYILVTSRGRR